MEKKFGLLVLVLFVICSLSFAEEPTAPVDKKDVQTTTKKEADVKEAQPVKMQMPEMPKLDPTVWNFLPETVAVVGDQKISKEELIKTLGPQVKMLLAMGQKLDTRQYQMLAKNMTDELVKAAILEKLAVDAGYKVTPKLVEEVYKKFTEKFKKQLPEGQDVNFADIIKKQGLNLEDVKEQLAKGEVVQEWITKKIAPEAKVDDAAAKNSIKKIRIAISNVLKL